VLGADRDDELAEGGEVLERRLAAERLVEHHAERPDVRAVIDAFAPRACSGDM
jgi:hypothetical protein